MSFYNGFADELLKVAAKYVIDPKTGRGKFVQTSQDVGLQQAKTRAKAMKELQQAKPAQPTPTPTPTPTPDKKPFFNPASVKKSIAGGQTRSKQQVDKYMP